MQNETIQLTVLKEDFDKAVDACLNTYGSNYEGKYVAKCLIAQCVGRTLNLESSQIVVSQDDIRINGYWRKADNTMKKLVIKFDVFIGQAEKLSLAMAKSLPCPFDLPICFTMEKPDLTKTENVA